METEKLYGCIPEKVVDLVLGYSEVPAYFVRIIRSCHFFSPPFRCGNGTCNALVPNTELVAACSRCFKRLHCGCSDGVYFFCRDCFKHRDEVYRRARSRHREKKNCIATIGIEKKKNKQQDKIARVGTTEAFTGAA